ncbi:PAS domain S-box, partial [Thiorhodovibrio frisius]
MVARGKLPSEPLTREASQQLIHELSVHQIELEIQNEELRRSQTELEASRARYFELYDLAPVGYVALNDGGLITEANLAAAGLLDLPRQSLINRRLSNWINPDEQDIFYICRGQLNAKAPQQQCELRLQRPDGSSLWAALALSLQPERESEAHCLVVLNDIDVHRQLDALRSQIEEDMLRRNAELNEHVQTRTAELEKTTFHLHQAEERFRYAMEASRDGLFDWQLTTDEVYFSPGYARMLGYQPGELPPNKSTWLNLLPPEQRESMEAYAQRQCLSPSGTITLEHQLRTKTGDYRWILGRGKVMERASDGTPIRVVGTHVDITEMHDIQATLEAERADLEAQVNARTAELRMQTERLTLATEAGGVGIWTWNPDTNAITWDAQVCKLYGHNSQGAALSVEDWKRRMRAEDIPRIRVKVRRVLNGKLPLLAEVFRIHADDGQERYLAARGRLMPLATAGERLLLGAIWDVTAEQRNTAALRASEAKARAVINASPVPLAITQKSGCVDHLNPAFVATFGYALDEIPTWSHWWNRAAPEPAKRARILAKLRKRTATSAQSGKPCSPFEITVRCQDGREATVVIRITALGDNQRIHTLYDITELSQAREAAQQAARAKSNFLSHMSHEIRTPLNAALGMTEVLERTHLDSEQLHLVRQVRMAGRSLLEILNDILDISRIEAGAMQTEQRPFALSSVLEPLAALLSSAARQKKIGLAISAPPPVESALLGDARRLKQILINLVGNAIKFTKHGGVRVEITLLEESTKKVSLRFEVVDTGIGIPPEILEHLFEPFVQGSVGVTRRFGGTGLGLAICKYLVEAMGGSIGAESLPGIGSLFWFDLTFERT